MTSCPRLPDSRRGTGPAAETILGAGTSFTPLLFRTGDMDLGIGFDAQAIFGAGRHETLRWLSENGYTDEHAHLSEWLSHAEDPKIEDWARQVRDYFYSPDGVLLLDEL